MNLRTSEIIQNYESPKIGTILSRTGLQIFLGAREEGFDTVGIGPKSRKFYYDAFPLARPMEYIETEEFPDILRKEIQEELIEKQTILIPHGSFVEYVGSKNTREKLYVPSFGNKEVLDWESDRAKEREWLEEAGLRVPRELEPEGLDELRGEGIIKFEGAKGGRNFSLVKSYQDYERKIESLKEEGEFDEESITIQQFIEGQRYYPSFFYSPLASSESPGVDVGDGKVELLGVDRRDESGFTVVGNLELVYRESLLAEVLEMAKKTVEASLKLFYPGMIGPFCLETVITSNKEIYVFEISARIVAGTNVAPERSRYSIYSYHSGMSMGRRIAREVKNACESQKLGEIVS